MPKIGIPEPTTDPLSLQATVKALKEAVEIMMGVRDNAITSAAVTREEVIATASFKEFRDRLGGSSDNVEFNPDGFTTSTAMTTALAGKSDVGHGHAQSDVTGLVTALAGKEPTIAAGTTGQYWRGDKSWQALPAAPVQKFANRYYATYTAQTTFTAQIPFDATIPLITEGTQIFSLDVTTTTATQILRIKLEIPTAQSNGYSIASVFVGSTCVHAGYEWGVTFATLHSKVEYAPGAAGTYAVTVRFGPYTGTSTINPVSLGGASFTTLCIDVIEP
ncbi:hypothetical protein UFOVP470_23 [uncultured Caudovirales phage]|uniref:Uncharacterized protein n=1 Tax=uncultured Caudovirales phage TaxID=2100421 RepID=A0A6J5MB58_9CAUD|nr:hypothetical protein UFOVP470_23 [uncultured Caudovirales phage]